MKKFFRKSPDIINADFPLYTKKVLKPIYEEIIKKRKQEAAKRKEEENRELNPEEIKMKLAQKFKLKD